MTFPRSEGQIPIYYYRKNTVVHRRHVYFAIYRYAGAPPIPSDWASYTEFTIRTYGWTDRGFQRIGNPHGYGGRDECRRTGRGRGRAALYPRSYRQRTQPLKRLEGFAKVKLEAGETKEVSFPISAEDLAIIGRSGEWAAEPGEFLVIAGPNAEEGLEAKFEYVE